MTTFWGLSPRGLKWAHHCTPFFCSTLFSFFCFRLYSVFSCLVLRLLSFEQPKRKAPSPANHASVKKAPVAPMVTVKKPAMSVFEKAANLGVSGITCQYVRVLSV